MENRIFEANFQRVFELALFLHQDKKSAFGIAINAFDKFYATARKQDRRLKNCEKTKSYRISLTDQQILQKLVLEASEQHLQEASRVFHLALDEVGQVIHYIKYLMLCSLHRNEKYAVTSIARLLHSYSSEETLKIFDKLADDPDCAFSSSHLGNLKEKLVEEVKRRFNLKTTKGANGEIRFVPMPDAKKYLATAQACLCNFTLWDTPHVFPENTRSTYHHNKNLAPECFIYHGITDPQCFACAVKELGMAQPEERFELPLFSLSQKNDSYPSPQPDSACEFAAWNEGRSEDMSEEGLHEDDYQIAREELARRAALRRTVNPDQLHILINGLECGTLNLTRQRRFEAKIDEATRLIEVKTDDGILLTTLIVELTEQGIIPLSVSKKTAWGQKLSMRIEPHNEDADRQYRSSAILTIAYPKKSFLRTTSIFIESAVQRLLEKMQGFFKLSPLVPISVTAMMICIAFVLGLFMAQPLQQYVQQMDNRALRQENDEKKKAQAKLEARIASKEPLLQKLGESTSIKSSTDIGNNIGAGGPEVVNMTRLEEATNRLEKGLREIKEVVAGNQIKLSVIPSTWPVRGYVTSGVGDRSNPFGGDGSEIHPGLDIAAPHGTAIEPGGDGIVIKAGPQGGYGNLVVIDHGYGITTRYGHLSRIDVKVGDHVHRGMQLGVVGSTGRSTGPHLHYEVRLYDRVVDPMNYLPKD